MSMDEKELERALDKCIKANTSEIEHLITKAIKADRADDALKFSQAACNAANARAVLRNDVGNLSPRR